METSLDPKEARARLAALAAALTEVYGTSGGVTQQMRKLKRLLPRYERSQLAALAAVDAALAEGRLGQDAAEIDAAAFAHAETAILMHLEGADREALRRRLSWDVATTVMVNVALAALIVFLAYAFL